jgi:hypothetical protein
VFDGALINIALVISPHITLIVSFITTSVLIFIVIIIVIMRVAGWVVRCSM